MKKLRDKKSKKYNGGKYADIADCGTQRLPVILNIEYYYVQRGSTTLLNASIVRYKHAYWSTSTSDGKPRGSVVVKDVHSKATHDSTVFNECINVAKQSHL